MVNWVAPDKHPSMLEMLPELVTPEYVTLEGIVISFSNVPVNTLYPIPYVKNVIYFDIFVYMYRLAQVNQSVSMLGYQKHMQNHIDVIFHVLDYINAYKEKADYDKLKELYMARRIAEMVHGQVDVFISFGSGDKVIQKKFKEFDAEVKEKNAYVYEKSGEFSGMLRLLRKSGFRFYSLIVRLSKVRNG